MGAPSKSRHPSIPAQPIDRLTRPFVRFLHVQSASGLILLGCTAVALVAANGPWHDAYHHFWETIVGVSFGGANVELSIHHWINDGLMTIFFFVIGLEIKRELVMGELSSPRRVVLPVAAAVGGAVVPLGIYLALAGWLGAEPKGWAIPMATDIAFVVGCLALLGDRVPRGLKVLMLSLAIVDDILAVVVIAMFYSAGLDWGWLVAAIAGLVITAGLNRLGVRRVPVYVIAGSAVWFCTAQSGLHATIAGVALGLLAPTSALLEDQPLVRLLDDAHRTLSKPAADGDGRRGLLMDVAFGATEAVSPLVRLETLLHPWVGFAIMPVFALANAAVPLSASSTADPVSIAVAVGLVVGKPVGILGASLVAIRIGAAKMPANVTFVPLMGAACLGGIGFTMAIFIAGLALDGVTLTSAKSGILLGSAISAALGMVILWRSLPTAPARDVA